MLLSPDMESNVEPGREQTVVTSDSWMAHCLSPLGLLNKQKNQGSEEEQEIVILDPSGMIVPGVGILEVINMEDNSIDWRYTKTRKDINASIF